MADDIYEFMQSHHIEKVALIGHSMGGNIAMYFALNYPDLVDKFVVVDVAPKAYEGRNKDILEALINFPIETIRTRNHADELMSQKIKNHTVRQFFLKNLKRDNRGKFIWKMNLPVIYREYDTIMKGIKHSGKFIRPTSFIRGGLSDGIEDKDIPMIKGFFPHAEIVTIPDAGHWIHEEKPDEFIKEVKGFLLK